MRRASLPWLCPPIACARTHSPLPKKWFYFPTRMPITAGATLAALTPAGLLPDIDCASSPNFGLPTIEVSAANFTLRHVTLRSNKRFGKGGLARARPLAGVTITHQFRLFLFYAQLSLPPPPPQISGCLSIKDVPSGSTTILIEDSSFINCTYA